MDQYDPKDGSEAYIDEEELALAVVNFGGQEASLEKLK